jgi:hypothetical protein
MTEYISNLIILTLSAAARHTQYCGKYKCTKRASELELPIRQTVAVVSLSGGVKANTALHFSRCAIDIVDKFCIAIMLRATSYAVVRGYAHVHTERTR